MAEARLAIGAGDRLTGALLSEATRELRLSSDILGGPGVKERIASCFAEIERAEGLAIKRGTGLLASVGSTGPFVGLFGTVWGIMNSFIGISKAQTTNLAVVAPGIAEALLATAIGLFAAIPAVLIYNHLARSTGSYLELVSNVAGELSAHRLARSRSRRTCLPAIFTRRNRSWRRISDHRRATFKRLTKSMSRHSST